MLTLIRNYSVRSVSKAVKRKEYKKKKKLKLKAEPIYEYAMAKSSDRRVYVWGLAEHGGLGVADKTFAFDHEHVTFAPKPHRSTFGEYFDVKDIACGYGFTAFSVRAKDGKKIYGSGINTDSQIGYDPSDEKLKTPVILKPRPVNIPLKSKETKILGLSAGRAHLLILTDEGLYTLGNNSYGQCGRHIINDENYFKSRVIHYIPNIQKKKIISVTAGQDHSVALTETGEVYTFGWGADGQTGLAHYRNESKPSLVKGDISGENIIKVSCASDCVLALSDKGKVFGWGNAEYNQLPSLAGSQQICIATELKMCQGLGHIIDIAAGGSFCMVLNSEGIVYVWGFGILGLGPKVQNVLKPTPIPQALFGANPYEPNEKVAKIFCGISQLAAITNSNALYMWGKNKYGSLGLGHRDDQYFPLKVSVGANVLKLSCGVDHVVSLCKPFV